MTDKQLTTTTNTPTYYGLTQADYDKLEDLVYKHDIQSVLNVLDQIYYTKNVMPKH